MAVAWRATGTAANGASGSLTPGLPTGHTTGDILIVQACSLDNVSHSVSGYTQIGSQTNNGASFTSSVWWKRDGGSESAPTVTHTSGNAISAVVHAFSGASARIGINSAWSANASSGTVTCATLTTNFDSSELVEIFCSAAVNKAYSTYSGSPTPTERFDGPSTASRPSMAMADSTITASGTAVGSRTSTCSGAAVNNGIQFTLIPPITLNATSGSFALSGTAATLEVGRKVSATSGTFTLTGTAVTMLAGYTMNVASGAFTETGTASTLEVGRKLLPSNGTFTLTGTASTLERGRKLLPASGTYALTGQSSTLEVGHVLSPASGAFTFTGTSATLERNKEIVAASGTFALTGTDATLTKSGTAAKVLNADPGVFALTGQSITFLRLHAYRLSAESGTFILGPGTAQFIGWSSDPSGSPCTWTPDTPGASDIWTPGAGADTPSWTPIPAGITPTWSPDE